MLGGYDKSRFTGTAYPEDFAMQGSWVKSIPNAL
jgi:hypothetical protein